MNGTTGGALFINNTTVQDNTGAGITIQPATGGVRIVRRASAEACDSSRGIFEDT